MKVNEVEIEVDRIVNPRVLTASPGTFSINLSSDKGTLPPLKKKALEEFTRRYQLRKDTQYLSLIWKLLQDDTAVASLLQEIPLPELIRIIESQPNEIKHSVGAATLLALRVTPLIENAAIASNMKSFLDGKYYLGKLKNIVMANERVSKGRQNCCYRQLLETSICSFDSQGARLPIAETSDFLDSQSMLPKKPGRGLPLASTQPNGAFLNNLWRVTNEIIVNDSDKQNVDKGIKGFGELRRSMLDSFLFRVLLVGIYAYAAWKIKAYFSYRELKLQSMHFTRLAAFSALGFAVLLSLRNYFHLSASRRESRISPTFDIWPLDSEVPLKDRKHKHFSMKSAYNLLVMSIFCCVPQILLPTLAFEVYDSVEYYS